MPPILPVLVPWGSSGWTVIGVGLRLTPVPWPQPADSGGSGGGSGFNSGFN